MTAKGLGDGCLGVEPTMAQQICDSTCRIANIVHPIDGVKPVDPAKRPWSRPPIHFKHPQALLTRNSHASMVLMMITFESFVASLSIWHELDL